MIKTTGISGFIAVSCCCLALVFFTDRELASGDSFLTGDKLNGKMKISIGNQNDQPDLIKKTLSQVKNRIAQFDFSIIEIDKNVYELTIKNIDDSAALKRLVTEPSMIRFFELFSIVEIEEGLIALGEEITSRNKNDARTLTEIISFSAPYELNGRQNFPSQVGFVKRRDTGYLNQLFNEEKVKAKFPPNITFAYGNYGDNPLLQDSILKIYALKTVQGSVDPFPKSNQISDATVDVDRLTKTPMIIFSFNKEGADAWHFMTQKNVTKPIAIVVNGSVFNAPFVEAAIEGGKSRIAGDFTRKECLHVVNLIKSGDLELPVKIIESKFSLSQ